MGSLITVCVYRLMQCRMVIAENLPQDSTRNSLEKIFGVIGRSHTRNSPCSLICLFYAC
jgi:hypothetical protein